MPLNRRRFILLSGLALGATGAIACTQSTAQSQSQAQSTTAPLSPQAQPSAPPSPHLPTAPAGYYAPPRGDIRFVVISDLNSAYGSTDYRREVIEGVTLLPDWQPDMVICAGDMVAGQSINLSVAEIEAMWTAFDEKVLSHIRAAGLPFALTVGNHDASSYQNENGEFLYILDRQATTKFWEGHQTDTDLTFIEASGFPYYYSFKQNNIFFLTW
ncbi:MAG: metallophosphoesterase, partial [Cyanobacteria bacterium J06623_4]